MAVAAALVLVLGGASAFLLLRPGDTSTAAVATPAAAPSAAASDPTSDAAEPTQAPTTAAVAPTQSPSPATTWDAPAPASYPAVVVAAGKECGRFGTGPWAAVGTYNDSTSCPFALNVRKAYLAAGLNGSAGTIEAYSPVTKKHYVMTCWGSQPAQCEGGVAARVVIYGGDFILDPTSD